MKPRHRQGIAITRRQRDRLVKERAEAILGSEPAVGAYAVHFDAQLRRRRLRVLLYRSYLRFSRAGAMAAGLDPREIW
jgi:hypothetical protein